MQNGNMREKKNVKVVELLITITPVFHNKCIFIELLRQSSLVIGNSHKHDKLRTSKLMLRLGPAGNFISTDSHKNLSRIMCLSSF